MSHKKVGVCVLNILLVITSQSQTLWYISSSSSASSSSCFSYDNQRIQIPGNPPVQVVAVFCATKEAHSVLASNSGEVCASGERAAALTLLKTFWDSAANASDAENNFCDERCKLIPSIEEGGWAIKMAVGQKPVLLGKKIHQAYHRGSNYLEIDIDISSSTIASNILGMVSRSLLLCP